MPYSSPPLIRNLEVDQVGVAGVDIGRAAVGNEVLLQNVFVYREGDTQKATTGEEDQSYLGVVDINHPGISEGSEVIDEPENLIQDNTEPEINDQHSEGKLETVRNNYIPTPVKDETNREDSYYREPPLLAPN